MLDWGKAWKAAAGIAFAVAIVMLLLNLLNLRRDETLITIAPVGTVEPRPVTVYVGGAVQRPGVYTLPPDARIEAAVTAAGGFAPEADPDGINRALRLHDEEQIIVPRRGEPTATPARPVASAPPSPALVAAAPTGTARASPVPSAGARINVNTAGAEELARLPGVGAKIAQDIIDFRVTNGPFSGPADLAKVRGISDRMVAEWRELITYGP